jgi:hypothetical protein
MTTPSPVPRPALQALAHAALVLADALETNFPVQGRYWAGACRPSQETEGPVIEALVRLRTCWFTQTDRGWFHVAVTQDDPPCAAALIDAVQATLAHYGWDLLPLSRTTGLHPCEVKGCRWSWPGIPPLPGARLDEVRNAARALLPKTPPPEPQPPELSKNAVRILRTMRREGWIDSAHCASQDIIADAASPGKRRQDFTRDFGQLRDWELIMSTGGGRGAGTYLTEAGIREADRRGK